jgi:hypothetical protein
MLPATYDIQHYRGDAFSLRFKFVNQDLTNQTVICECRNGLQLNSQKLFEFDTQATLDGVDTLIDISVAAGVTSQLNDGIYYWDLQVGDYTRVAGQLEVIADVSRG